MGIFPLAKFYRYCYGKWACNTQEKISWVFSSLFKVTFQTTFHKHSRTDKELFWFYFWGRWNVILRGGWLQNVQQPKKKLYTERKISVHKRLNICLIACFFFLPFLSPTFALPPSLPNTLWGAGPFCLVSTQLQLLRHSLPSPGNLESLHWLIKLGSLNKPLKLLYPQLAYLIQITG